MIYYRVALRLDQSNTWRWKSTVLASLDALFGFLKLYSMVPKDDIRIFFSSSTDFLHVMLARENKGLASNSITAEQLLHGGKISGPEMIQLELELGARESREMVATSASIVEPSNERNTSSQYERSRSCLDMRRLELELGATGDHDTPYWFSLPTSFPQALAWTKLLLKVQTGVLEP
jgi:hypothetical protein